MGQEIKRNKENRKMQYIWTVTACSCTDDFYHFWEQLSQLSDTGMWAICQISNLNIYLKVLLHGVLAWLKQTAREIKWSITVTKMFVNTGHFGECGMYLLGGINKSSKLSSRLIFSVCNIEMDFVLADDTYT